MDAAKSETPGILEVKMFRTSASAKPKQCLTRINDTLVEFWCLVWCSECDSCSPNSNFLKENQKLVLHSFSFL